MTTLRKTNKRKARALRQHVVAHAYLEWLDRAERLTRTGKMHLFKTSNYIRKQKRKARLARSGTRV